ncbi:HPr kinase/phosphorylase [hydrothermal vent metagenome]|uniref:HPr kinase/phosphorylase n=1 Tax=hydrothermal vent metagenome TaxID=652676 RepID=A0A3B0YUM8_9ZZZZ
MNTDASVGTLFNTLEGKLDLNWAGGRTGEARSIKNTEVESGGATLVGHLNLIHPNRVQILGETETGYLQKLPEASRRDFLDQLFDGTSDLIVVGDDMSIPDEIKQRSEASATPLLVSSQPTPRLVNYLQYYLTSLFANKITLHGVFMEVFSVGLLIIGDPSVGKSELALELLARGHRLVADDAPIFARTAPDTLNGRCPDVLRDFLEVRGLGILNIRAIFGDSAIKQARNLRLVLKLVPMTEGQIHSIDRLYGARSTQTILGVEIPEITLPVAPGRNLAVLAEAAARNHTLLLKGFDSAKLFMDRQSRFMDNG